MNPYCSRSELKNTAKESLAGRYKSIIFVTIFASLMVVPITYFQSLLESLVQQMENGQSTLLGDIILFFLASVFGALCNLFNIGIYLLYLKIACKQSYSLYDLWYCFRGEHFQKAFMVSFWTRLPGVICTLPSVICARLFLQSQSSTMGLYMTMAFIVGMIVQLPINLALSMSYFLMLDFPQYSVKDILSHSIQLMKGNKGRLFSIEISFLPLHILGICSIGIGYLWLTPYINMTRALFFLDLMNPSHKNTRVI